VSQQLLRGSTVMFVGQEHPFPRQPGMTGIITDFPEPEEYGYDYAVVQWKNGAVGEYRCVDLKRVQPAQKMLPLVVNVSGSEWGTLILSSDGTWVFAKEYDVDAPYEIVDVDSVVAIAIEEIEAARSR
jgi:hypothetical protein